VILQKQCGLLVCFEPILYNLRPVTHSLPAEAKARFEVDDLMERARALIEESIGFGVTHMRAFVEVDLGVGMKVSNTGSLILHSPFTLSFRLCTLDFCIPVLKRKLPTLFAPEPPLNRKY